MWKSRIDKLPPAQFFADLLQHLRNLYPGANLDESLARAMRDIWIAEWRNGQNAQDTAKATCSCDGKTIMPSAGAGRELGKRLARPPKGAKRGDFIAPDSLREVTSLAIARREAEKYAQAFDRVRGAAVKLLQTKGWTAAKGVRLQKLKTLLHEIKAKHDAAVAKYEEVKKSRREAKQPELYEKPLGAVGLSLRPDELPEPPPPKEKKPKEKKAPKEKKPKEKKAPKEKKPAAEKPKKEPAPPAWQPPANLPQTGLAGNFSVMVEAVPNEDFSSSSSPDGRHKATIKIPARTYSVGTLGAARALLRAFIDDNGLGGGNMPPTAGRVLRDGKPFVHISYNGRIWRVDGKWNTTGQELDESGQPKESKPPEIGDLVKFTAPGPNGPMNLAGTVKRVLPDGRLEIKSQNHGYFTLHPSELTTDCNCKKKEKTTHSVPEPRSYEVEGKRVPILSLTLKLDGKIVVAEFQPLMLPGIGPGYMIKHNFDRSGTNATAFTLWTRHSSGKDDYVRPVFFSDWKPRHHAKCVGQISREVAQGLADLFTPKGATERFVQRGEEDWWVYFDKPSKKKPEPEAPSAEETAPRTPPKSESKAKARRKSDSATPTAPQDTEPKQKGKRKEKAAKKPAEKEAPKAALSDSEAEELANLFATASEEDKPK